MRGRGTVIYRTFCEKDLQLNYLIPEMAQIIVEVNSVRMISDWVEQHATGRSLEVGVKEMMRYQFALMSL